MKNKYLLLLLFAFAGISTGCDKDNDENVQSGSSEKEWIYKQMKANYLWLDEIKEMKYYKTSADPNDFFAGLISSNEKKSRNGMTYWYSYMEKRKSTTKVSDSAEETYGIEYALYSIEGKNYYLARVIYVLPDSPAEKAGIKRGMWIKTINGNTINASNRSLLSSGNGIELGVYEGKYTSDLTITGMITVSANKSMYESPFLKDTVLIGNNGTRIGYLAYTHFSTGPTGFADKQYDSKMKELFGKFKSAGVREFILDLRYNPGGYLDCAVLLSSLLVPASRAGKVFCQVMYNPKSTLRSHSDVFQEQDNNLNITQLYVLTGSWTASASEAVINGLKPMMDVYVVGDKTEGKNLGSVTFDDSRYDYILHPIVAKIANANGEGDYWDGISPSDGCVYQEFQDAEPLGALGSYQDKTIRLAVDKMNLLPAQYVTTKAASFYGGEKLSPLASSLERKSVSAIRIN